MPFVSSSRQEEEFGSAVGEVVIDAAKEAVAENVGKTLDPAVAWISENLTPETVYGTETLREWALDNGFVEAPD